MNQQTTVQYLLNKAQESRRPLIMERYNEFVNLPMNEKAHKYQRWVETLIAPPPANLPPDLEESWNVGHMGLGLAGELMEFDLENNDFTYQILEMGDVIWYAVNIATLAGIQLSELFSIVNWGNHYTKDKQMFDHAEAVVNSCKRFTFYQIEAEMPILKDAIKVFLYDLMMQPHFICAIELNFLKLIIRFESAFTQLEATIKRA